MKIQKRTGRKYGRKGYGSVSVLRSLIPGAMTCSSIFLLLLVLPVSVGGFEIGPAESYNVYDSAVYQWTSPYPQHRDLHQNLTLNTTIREYPVLPESGATGENYGQSLILSSNASVVMSRDRPGDIPVNRILDSSVLITNVSENLDIIPVHRNFYGDPVDPNPLFTLRNIGTYFRSLDSAIHGSIVPGYGINAAVSQDNIPAMLAAGILELFAIPVTQNYNPPGIPVDQSWDHRQGFLGDATDHSFNSVEISTRTRSLDIDRRYSGTIPASFTYTGRVTYCEHDLVLGFCSGQVRQMTRTLVLTRAAIPADASLPGPDRYPFVVTDSDSGVIQAA
jgi:hypothetical protein